MPKYQHDCTKCKYLGRTIGNGKIVDLYVHNDTLIARYGDDGPDYYSGLVGYISPNGHAELFVADFLNKKGGVS